MVALKYFLLAVFSQCISNTTCEKAPHFLYYETFLALIMSMTGCHKVDTSAKNIY